MLNMKEKAVLVKISTLAAVLTASLIRASLTYEVELVVTPDGPYVTSPAGEPFNISCQALGGNKSKCFMQWLDMEGNAIGAGIPGVVKDENNSLLLTFTDPTPEDSETYTCTAVYDNEQNLKYEVDIVFYGEPEFKSDFENMTVIEGQRVEVFCSAESSNTVTEITYKWYNQSGDEITEMDGSIYTSSRWYGSWLVIEEAKFHHEGMYTCSANNSYGLSSSKLYYIGVSPKPRPEFKIDFENMTVIEGQRVEVYCSAATGENPITYEWYNQSGEAITAFNGSIYISSRWYGSWLIITEAKLDHGGIYTCSANNSHGLSSKLYYIGVSPKPDVAVLNVSANSVQFRIVVSGFVEGIEVMYGEMNRKEYRTNFTLAPDDIYSFENLVPSGLYVFKFRILPLNGNSEWLETFQVTLLPDKPEIIIRRVEKNSIEFELFRKEDDIRRETIDKYEIKYYSLQMQSGNYWIPSTCVTTIELPSCSAVSHTISGLQQKVHYQIEVSAHTDSGYGEPTTQKIYIPG